MTRSLTTNERKAYLDGAEEFLLLAETLGLRAARHTLKRRQARLAPKVKKPDA